MARFQLRRKTASAWTSSAEVLLDGEAGYEKDTGKLKVGDGSTAWGGLPYFAGSGGGGGSLVAPFSYPGSLSLYVGQGGWTNIFGRTLTIQAVYADLAVGPTGASVIADVNLNGTTIFTTQANRLVIPVGSTAVKRTNMDVTAVPDGGRLTVDIDQIGSSNPQASYLTVQVLMV